VPWDLKVADDVKPALPPTEQEIYWIRDFDPTASLGRSQMLNVFALAMGRRAKVRAQQIAEKNAAAAALKEKKPKKDAAVQEE
jgi:hypothetical protein